MDIQKILKNESVKYFDHRKEYRASKIVKTLLKHNIDIRERVEYYNGWRKLDSITWVAILLNETKIFEIMTQNRKKLNPNVDIQNIEKNTYQYAKTLNRKDILKIMEKYGISDDNKPLTEKRKKMLLKNLERFWLSYKQIKCFDSKGIDILHNMKFIKASLQAESPLSWAIMIWDNKIYDLIFQNRRLFKEYFDWDIDKETNFLLAKMSGNKKIIQSLETFRKKIDNKRSIIERWQHYIESGRYEAYEELKKKWLWFDQPYNKWLWYVEARLCRKNRDFLWSVKTLQRRLEHDPQDHYAYFHIASSFYLLWRNTEYTNTKKEKIMKIYQEAIKNIQKAIKIALTKKVTMCAYYLEKWNILQRIWKYRWAIQAYKEEAKRDPKWIRNRENALQKIKECKETIKRKK